MSAALISDLAKQSTPELLNDVTFYLRKESMLKNKGLLTVQRSRVESVRTVLVEQMGITSRIARLVAEKRSEDRGLVPTVAHFCTAAFNVVHASCFGERADENLIFLRAMTAAILIYDSTREGGVLGPGSAVNLRFILQFLKKNSARLLKQPELVAELGRVIKV